MKVLRLLLVIIFSLILGLVLRQFFFCPRYNFVATQPFAGSLIYNPYEAVNPKNWIKCNFHAHSQAWCGITNGEGTVKEVGQAYDSLKYDVRCISNYQQIDSTYSRDSNYISAYEHGYNMHKTHQLVLGGHKVTWLDYIFPQTLNNKQDILNRLSADTNAVVILNHPAVRRSYSKYDLNRLSNYNCMEVLNPAAISQVQWDAALSAGKPVFIVGNDDSHSAFDKSKLGILCTFVNVEKKHGDQVLEALKKGKSFGMIIGRGQSLDSLPVLNYLNLRSDSVFVEMSAPAERINFIGQNGGLLASFPKTSHAQYLLTKDDHYARVTAEYKNGTVVFLNPVFYTHSLPVSNRAAVVVNASATWLFRAVGTAITLVWIAVAAKFMRGWEKARFAKKKGLKKAEAGKQPLF